MSAFNASTLTASSLDSNFSWKSLSLMNGLSYAQQHRALAVVGRHDDRRRGGEEEGRTSGAQGRTDALDGDRWG